MRPYRREKVASAIHEIVGDLLVRGLKDPRVDTLTTVTRVEVTGDLLIARVFVTVPGDAAAESRTLNGLRHAAGYFRSEIAHQLDMRTTPEVRFEIDDVAKRVRATMLLLEENRRKNPELFRDLDEDKPKSSESDDDSDDDDLDESDEDEQA